jgi:hypothetical protein
MARSRIHGAGGARREWARAYSLGSLFLIRTTPARCAVKRQDYNFIGLKMGGQSDNAF